MEELYRPHRISCTEHIPLKECFSKFSALLNQDSFTQNIKKILKHKDITIGTKHLKENTRISHLINPVDDQEESSNSSQSRVLKSVQVRKTLQHRFPSLKSSFSKVVSYADSLGASKTNYYVKQPQDEFALNVRIYHPFEFNYNNNKTNGFQNIKFSHEIIALGKNTLAELRDKIECFNDNFVFKEVKTPQGFNTINIDLKQEYPSGFIFIDDVFYNDFRNPLSIDYSEGIIEWAKKNKIQPFDISTMHTTTIDQLSPRLGYPYVYVHQGKCEHILMFTDVWLLMNEYLALNEYPKRTAIHNIRSKMCVLCNCTAYQWMVVNCQLLPHAQSFLCSDCLIGYLYKDDEMICNFSLYQCCGAYSNLN